ncbi:MAG: hypothetical protein WCX74_03090 [Candidatus Paceibacterota bacterium]
MKEKDEKECSLKCSSCNDESCPLYPILGPNATLLFKDSTKVFFYTKRGKNHLKYK